MTRVVSNSRHHLMTLDSDSLFKNLCNQSIVKSVLTRPFPSVHFALRLCYLGGSPSACRSSLRQSARTTSPADSRFPPQSPQSATLASRSSPPRQTAARRGSGKTAVGQRDKTGLITRFSQLNSRRTQSKKLLIQLCLHGT